MVFRHPERTDVRQLSESCPITVPNLSQNCPNTAPKAAQKGFVYQKRDPNNNKQNTMGVSFIDMRSGFVTGTEKEKSTGMGLILCKEYARIINADLEASSTISDPENDIVGGSVFCLTLS